MGPQQLPFGHAPAVCEHFILPGPSVRAAIILESGDAVQYSPAIRSSEVLGPLISASKALHSRDYALTTRLRPGRRTAPSRTSTTSESSRHQVLFHSDCCESV